MELSENINHLVFIVDNDLISISALNTDDREAIESIYYLYGVSKLKGPSQPPPFSMTSKLLIKLCEANSYCFTVSCVPEGMFNYLE